MSHSTTCFSLMLTENGLHGLEHHTVDINGEVTDAVHTDNDQRKTGLLTTSSQYIWIPSFEIGNLKAFLSF